MNRRDFLFSLAAGSGMLLPIGGNAWAAQAGNGMPTKNKLIVIMLRGAVDGLNVVAPYGDSNYARLRPGIALPKPGQEGGALNLDGYFGLHPALGDLNELWQQKKLAFVHSSGSPDTTRSHFDAQDYLESATPGRKSTQDGWMNRLLASLPGLTTPTRGISVGAVMPRILSGSVAATNIASGAAGTKANVLDRPKVGSAFEALYKDNDKYAKAFGDAKEAHQEMMGASMENEQQAADGGAPLPNGFPDDSTRIATLMRNDPKIQIVFMALGGWDTHANQGAGKGQLANRLSPLGLGLANLARRLGPLFDDTTIVVMSEFGRTAKQNGNGGTDHGHGNVMWILGGKVAGGKVYGDWRGLASDQLYEGRDLAVTTDFRSVLAQVCERHMGLSDNQLVKVFPDHGFARANFNLYQGKA
ncbi:DUF1501 domain-containing protein [Undibacterium sp. TS12]|uniref:DUF1501 domain-containing protein n=1 Tax=Undibacterium sp. TS12 TaxID=2908202 RepID=UPI001F4D0272|nr:DUF1501 domain-containing protein [Undibacterium sp. TS12]MCH8620783.1 DUF1501 domain-containing protein [Undibacterium sp. TS12]